MVKIGKELFEEMIEIKVQEKNCDSYVANDSKNLRQEDDNMEPLTLNGKATFISSFYSTT